MGRKFIRSTKNVDFDNSELILNFINSEKPDIIILETCKDFEEPDIKESLKEITLYPLRAVILEGNRVKINLFNYLYSRLSIDWLFAREEVQLA